MLQLSFTTMGQTTRTLASQGELGVTTIRMEVSQQKVSSTAKNYGDDQMSTRKFLFAIRHVTAFKTVLFMVSFVILFVPDLCLAAQRFFGPEGLVLYPPNSNQLWVANSGNNSVIEVCISTGCGSGVLMTLTDPQLQGPSRLAFDSSGNLYVANTAGNNVLEFRNPLSSNSATVVPFADPLNRRLGLAIDSDDTLYVHSTISICFLFV